MSSPATSYYFDRFGFPQNRAPLIAEPPHPALGQIVVIPCFNEPNLVGSLESLWRCARPECAVEVIVVVNSSETSPPEVLEQNQRTVQDAGFWSKKDCDRYFRVHLLDTPNLPRKHAGVGLARKMGMDEALRRFDAVNNLGGVIICFDADSQCDPNYLTEIEKFFRSNPKSPGCSIYYEHPLEGSEPREIYEAIILYELHLRYYVQGLRHAGFPHAFHTVGSSMAVRAEAYMKQGGMNKRQAGEDFYFLHKIIPLGHFGEVNTTRVVPSPRASDRVPFGTGRSVREYLESGRMESYPLAAFEDLRKLFASMPRLRESDASLSELAAPLQDFLRRHHAAQMIEQIGQHTATTEAFCKRFFHWFDGFMAMKYIHHARDTAYGAAEATNAAASLLCEKTEDPRRLLLRYRALQKTGLA